MSNIKCQDIADMVIEEVTDNLSSSHRLNDLGYRIFKQYCNIFDVLAEEFEGQSFSVEVNPDDLSMNIIMVCPMITADESSHLICELMKRSLSFAFEPFDTEYLSAEFVFPGIWDER